MDNPYNLNGNEASPTYPPVMPVDSKGAEIDKAISEHECIGCWTGKLCGDCRRLKQAILAILAQEVKRVIGEDNARVDNLHLESPAHQKAYKENLWIVNLVKAEQRRKAGLV